MIEVPGEDKKVEMGNFIRGLASMVWVLCPKRILLPTSLSPPCFPGESLTLFAGTVTWAFFLYLCPSQQAPIVLACGRPPCGDWCWVEGTCVGQGGLANSWSDFKEPWVFNTVIKNSITKMQCELLTRSFCYKERYWDNWITWISMVESCQCLFPNFNGCIVIM